MICHKSKCIFVHIPKTGGQSIEYVFLDLHALSWDERAGLLLRKNDDPTVGPPRLAHLTATEYTEFGHISQIDFEKYFKFSVVRNPWDRLVSEYRFRKIGPPSGFKAWLLDDFPQPGWTDEYRHVTPQSDFLFDGSGECVVDFIGRFEQFKDDVCKALDLAGLRDYNLRHINSSSRGLRRLATAFGLKSGRGRESLLHYYDDESIEWVDKKYSEDIRRFNYVFPG